MQLSILFKVLHKSLNVCSLSLVLRALALTPYNDEIQNLIPKSSCLVTASPTDYI